MKTQSAWPGSGEGAGPGPGYRPEPGGGAGRDPAARETITLNRAREELGLDFTVFELALQLGEIRTVPSSGGQWRVPRGEVARLRDADGPPQALLDRLRLVTSTEGAALIGISRDRLVRLARLGLIRPVRWYVNRYRALVWVYLGHELREFALGSPALLHGRLPAGLRDALDDGEDQRARGWRSRRVSQLVRDSHDAWEEAAVWAALLGPEVTDDAVPDPYDRARLRRIRTALPPGRPGALAGPELIRGLTTADHPDEIALALVALADALGRARAEQPAPHPAAVPLHPAAPAHSATPDRSGVPVHPARPVRPARPAHPPLAVAPAPSRDHARTAVQAAARAGSEADVPIRGRTGTSVQERTRDRTSDRTRDRSRDRTRDRTRPRVRTRSPRSLLGLLRGRGSAADLPEEPLLHHGDQETPLPVEDLAPRQAAGARGDG